VKLNLSLILAKKEIKEIILRSKYILSTIIIIPIVIGAVLPLVLSLVFITVPEPGPGEFIFPIPPLLPGWDLLTSFQQYFVFFINLYAGLMNLIIPLMLPVYIAADSFAGEKERKTLEPILASPMSDFEILLGKTFTSLIPSLIASIVSILLSVIIINFISISYIGLLIYPVLPIIILYVLAVPIMTIITIFAMILVSSKVQRVREATQLGGVVLIPIIILFFTQIFGLVPFDIISSLFFVAILMLIAIILIFIGTKLFNRQKLIEAF
jgi:ABC-2 type transport system permease protein